MVLHVLISVSVEKNQLDLDRALMALRAFDGAAYMMAKRKVGDPRDAQDFRTYIQQKHDGTESHFRMETVLVDV